MKLDDKARTLVSQGFADTTVFKINAVGKAFRALIDGIYSDKIGTPVRELCTNAWDAHTVVGQTKPFFVHAPTMMKPEFFVRDYGVGMAHDLVQNLYTTLFQSNKDATDDLVGAYGLGSKSPFAYSDQFYVHCYDGPAGDQPGSMRSYLACIGSDGVPRLDSIPPVPSSEPTGVKVGMAVEAKDFEKFEKAIREIAFGFDPVFETNLDTLKGIGGTVPVLKGTHWYAYRTQDQSTGSPTARPPLPGKANWYVRQGCVIYPLEESKAPGLLPEGNYYHCFILDMPIGSVMVTQSREAIQYTDQVIANIRQRIDVLTGEIQATIVEQTKDIASVADYHTMVTALKPTWLKHKFAHPATGLDTASLTLSGFSCLINASDNGERWNYDVIQYLSCTKSEGPTQKIFVLNDIGALLDPELHETRLTHPGPTSECDLSLTERRRLCRLFRHYLQTHKLPRASFAIQVPFSAEFWKHIHPNVELVVLSIQDLKNAVPRSTAISNLPKTQREAARATQPVRGITLAKGETTTAPVVDLPSDPTGCAWIESETWRRSSSVIWNTAKLMGVTSLFLISPTRVEEVTASGIPTIANFIVARLRQHKLKPVQLLDYLESSDYFMESYHRLGRRLAKKDGALEKVLRCKGFVSDVLKLLKPFLILERELELVQGFDGATKGSIISILSDKGQIATHTPRVFKGVRDRAYHNSSGIVHTLTCHTSNITDDALFDAHLEVLLLAQKRVEVPAKPAPQPKIESVQP